MQIQKERCGFENLTNKLIELQKDKILEQKPIVYEQIEKLFMENRKIVDNLPEICETEE